MTDPLDSLNTSMLAVRIANETDLPERVVQRIILRMTAEIKAALLRREEVELDGIGTLKVADTLCRCATPDPDAEPVLNGNLRSPGSTYRKWTKGEEGYLQIITHVVLKQDKDLCAQVQKISNPDGIFRTRRFTQSECDEIRRSIQSGEATIKGVSRRLGTTRNLIRKIVRAVNHKPETERNEDE